MKRYISNIIKNNKLRSVPSESNNIKVNNMLHLHKGHQIVFGFSLTYFYQNVKNEKNIVLKFYEEKHLEKLKREYYILKYLNDEEFPVPYVYLYEINVNIFGYPFIVMEKIEGDTFTNYIKNVDQNETYRIIGLLAKTLVSLHNLRWENMEIKFKYEKDKIFYAKTKANLKDELDYAINWNYDWIVNWLNNNASKCSCDSYSLLHKDMNPKNFLIDKEGSKIIFIDWEYAEIGDALIDVGLTYHNIRHMFGIRYINNKGAHFSSYFLKQYIEYSQRKIIPFNLKYYLIVSGLCEILYLRYVIIKIKNPLNIPKLFEFKYMFFYPYLYLHYKSRYQHLEKYLEQETMDYEQSMFGTLGGKLVSNLELMNVIKFLKADSSEIILDIGTGSGRIANAIISKSNAEVIGIDVGPPVLQSTKTKKGSIANYKLVMAEGQHLPFRNNSFDAVTCIRTVKYFKDPIRGISEMTQVIKRGKRIIIDFSSILGYEFILRFITHSLPARNSHVFNIYRIKYFLRNQNLFVADMYPLQIIPQKIWNLINNLTILHLLMIAENILRKLTPLIVSRSVLFKCIKVDLPLKH